MRLARCAGEAIGPGKLGERFTPTPTEIAGTTEHLCDSGADVDAFNELEETPQHTAVGRGDLVVVKFLCDWGANLEFAIEEYNLLDMGAPLPPVESNTFAH